MWSLALIGNTSGRNRLSLEKESTRGVFDKETRRRSPAFVADAVR
jgi:hypothetical protein